MEEVRLSKYFENYSELNNDTICEILILEAISPNNIHRLIKLDLYAYINLNNYLTLINRIFMYIYRDAHLLNIMEMDNNEQLFIYNIIQSKEIIQLN